MDSGNDGHSDNKNYNKNVANGGGGIIIIIGIIIVI